MTTDFAIMPPVISMQSSDEDDVAFKVLNQDDDLPITTTAIVGESIFNKPLFSTGNKIGDQKQRPNGIVYPTRRSVPAASESVFVTKSHGNLNEITENHANNKNIYLSQGNLNKNRLPIDTKFTRTLDAKLRKLQSHNNATIITTPDNSAINNTSNNNSINKKQPFITTVKKGEFLEPPPEIASLIGIKLCEESKSCNHNNNLKENRKILYYAYASEPRVLNRISPDGKNASNRQSSGLLHKMRCEAAAKAAACVISSVANLNHLYHPPNQKGGDKSADDHIGRITKRAVDVPLPYANLMFEKRIHRGSNFAPCPSGHMGDGESAAARAAEARRRALARKRAKNQHVRAAQLRLGSPPPVPGRIHEPVQTELYLEEIFNNPPAVDTCTQTELFLERPISPFYVPAKTGADAETQIYPGDLFDYDMEVQPILEVLVGKTIEQSLIEVLEEEELAALREQQRKFLEVRAAEVAEAQRLEEREKRIFREKERRMKEYEEGSRLQKEMEERIAASVLMQGYMADLLPSILEGLESEGFLVDSIKEEIDESFMPWLMREVTQEVKEIVSSRDVLTDIVREILETRAEIYKALNQSPRSIPDEEEEEYEGQLVPNPEDVMLAEHLKLQREIQEQKLLSQEEFKDTV